MVEINESTSLKQHDPGFIQGEPFRLRDLGDGRRGKSFVIPIGRGRALRLGWRINLWCKIGPRRYKVVASRRFVEQWEELGGNKEELRESGAFIEGDLNAVEE